MIYLLFFIVHIILHVVVFLVMITLVDSPVLLPILVIIITIGTLALLYCSSYYAFRGGDSSAGANCGAFSVAANAGVGFTYWGAGAALSFKL